VELEVVLNDYGWVLSPLSPKGCNGDSRGVRLLSKDLTQSLFGGSLLSFFGPRRPLYRKKACGQKRLSPAKSPCGCQITKLLTIQVMLPPRVTAGVLRIFCPPEGKELFAPS
jgi:hypothetical protein